MRQRGIDEHGGAAGRLRADWRTASTAWLALSLAIATVLAIIDVAADGATLIGFLIVAPLVAAVALTARATAVVTAYAVLLAVLLGLPDDIFGETDHVSRVLVVLSGGALAVWGAARRGAGEREAMLLTTQGAVARILAESPSLTEVTPRLLEAIGTTLRWDAGSLWSVDATGEVLRCVETWHRPGIDVASFEAMSNTLAFEPGRGLPGQVWGNCAPLWLSDFRDEQDHPRAPAAKVVGLRGGFGFPVKGEEGCVGAIEFFSTDVRSPDPELLELMDALGAQIGQYIDRMRAQMLVAESDALKTAILESALDCVITIDHRGRIVEFNPAASATFGYSREEVLGKEMAELLVPAEYRERHRRGIEAYLETGEGPILNRRIELSALRSDGTEFPIELTITPIDTEGPRLFTGYLRDITDRRRADEERERLTEELMAAGIELGRSRNQLHAILEGIADGVTAQDPTGRLVYANEAAVRTLGYTTPDELLSAPASEILEKFEILDEEGNPFPVSELPGRHALMGERPPDRLLRFRIRATGEERWSIVKATPILDEDGRAVLAINIFEDITEHKHAEQTQRFLSEASQVLVGSLDYETTLEQVAWLAVPSVADWCAVEVVEPGGGTQQVAVAHVDPEKIALAKELRRRYPPDPSVERGVHHVIRTGVAELYPDIPDEMLVGMTRDEEHLEMVRSVGLCSGMVVPMRAFGRTLGAITFASAESARRFTEKDLELAEELARRAAVAVENSRIYSERSYIARTLQESLLPPHLPDLPGVEIAARYQAAGEAFEVGGDFYDIFQTGPESWAAVIGDVRGKGAGAASVTALARYTVRAAAMREHMPSLILSQLNEAMVRHGSEDRFCTVAFAALDPIPGGVRATVSCGGHPMPLVLRADGRVHPVGSPGTLLGLVRDPDLVDDAVELAPGDALVLYTDGVSEARRNQELFGEERLVELLQSCSGLDAARIVERIQRQVIDFQDQLYDDVAVLVLRVRARDALRARDAAQEQSREDAPSTAPA